MQLHHRDIIDAPQETVFNLVKNHLPEIGAYLGNIETITKISEQPLTAHTTKIVNHW